jgi:hypothetical protein
MAKQIALNLTINGVKNSITNINQLNAAIKEAEEDLKDIEIGSDNFKQLSKEIKNAKNIVEDFNESIKGQKVEERIGAFAKVGEAVTSSFAGAQAALSLFGAESDEVAKAAAQAQALLTVALAARSAAEGVVAVRTVAQTIATQASAAAAAAATTATRTLYATLAANPYGAILAVIGLVIGALIAFTGESEKATNVSKELAQATSSEADALKESLTILTRYTGLKNLQRQEIEKLKKEYPGFNAFIDKENRLTQEGVKFIQLRIKQYELEAQAKLLIQKIAEQQIKILEIEASSAIETVTFWQGAINFIRSGGNISRQAALDLQSGLKNQREEIEKINKTTDIYRGALDKVRVQTDQVLGEIEPYNKQLKIQADANELAAQKAADLKKQQEDIKKAQDAARTSTISYSEEIKKLNAAFDKYAQTIDRISKLDYATTIVDDLKKIQQARIDAIKELISATDQVNKSIKSVSEITQDEFLGIFVDFRKQLEDAFVAGGKSVLNFEKIYTDTTTKFTNLTQKQKDILFDFGRGYREFDNLVRETPGFRELVDTFGEVIPAFDDFRQTGNQTFKDAQGFLVALGDISAALGEFRFEIDEAGKVQQFPFDPQKVSENSKATLQKIREGLFLPIGKQLLELKRQSLETQIKNVIDPVALAGLKVELKRVEDAITEAKTSGKIDLKIIKPEEITQGVDKAILEFNRLLSAIVTGEQKILSINAQVQQLTDELANNAEQQSRAVGGIILANIDAISQILIGARTKQQKEDADFLEKVKNDEAGLQKFKEQLLAKGFRVEATNQKDLLDAFIAFKKKELEVTKQTEKDKQDAQNETIQKIQQGFEIFSTTLNQISGLVNERVQTDLEGLQIAQQKALENVVGDSETAAQKRLEIQEEYEAKSKEIEKKGRITALRFSQAQTIANTAQAVVRALAELGPIAGPIFAGINSAIGLAQIAIIEDQISNARSLRRGGVVRAQGGMIIGPSHENGGVRLAQAGIIAEGNESIINRQSTLDYQSLLSSINVAGGGRPLVYNNFDDSRIVEAIAKQQQKPIRAYVLGSEITNEQAISRRLDDLSKI